MIGKGIALQIHHIRTFSTNAVARKPRVVVVGCGWAGFRFAQDIDKSIYDVSLVSPRNHFLFTPLLPSTAVGTLEFRCIQEPVRTIPGLHYHQAYCNQVEFNEKTLHCSELFKNTPFELKYDYLVVAPGSETNTFNVPGVDGNPRVFFLKQLDQARLIRNKLIESFERAGMPSIDPAERTRLLTFVVVGGGPTNIEFASELHDFLTQDVARCYADLLPFVKVVVVEASGHILGTFKSSLVDYVERLFVSRRIEVRTGTTVNAVEQGNIAVLGDGTRLPFGMMVWSTGIKQVEFIRNITSEVAHARGGRLVVDGKLRLLAAAPSATSTGTSTSGGGTDAATTGTSTTSNSTSAGHPYGPPVSNGTVFALGDCACDAVKPLPALAQVTIDVNTFNQFSASTLAHMTCHI
jgi:NADH:ubiquinone reductase (H+-translocating)